MEQEKKDTQESLDSTPEFFTQIQKMLAIRQCYRLC